MKNKKGKRNNNYLEKKWFCLICNAYVSEEIGMKRVGLCPGCNRETHFFPSYS